MFSLKIVSRFSSTAPNCHTAACNGFATANKIRLFSVASLKESYSNILVDVQKANDKDNTSIALITLNRPKALNALNDALFGDLLHATQLLDKDKDVRCIVLTGSTKAFAAGADISEMKDKTYEECMAVDMFAEWQQISKLKTPIVAAVAGFCLGGGCELAMMCDMIVCSKSAKFGQPEINLGVIAGAGGTQRLTKRIGKAKSMYMNLTGEFINAEEAFVSGLVAKVFDNETLVEEALKIAKNIAAKGALSVQAAKEAVNAAEDLPLQEGLRLERRLFHALFATDDQKEGMAAFLEKRPASFK
ncbi:enoyl-CoA hydratase/isomerase [Nitzschia inconspicua]|uniref:Probable enoyl-CoA hydratase, mitochondrial n=1 Tax=Nitzschia inconspicua TaxID=303405 RepID=A0A9K3KUB3_9STRA|nr:enoyl-CoA hydratase/isomerase [Nitzschia inconspicua]